jgi:hypothetical protein
LEEKLGARPTRSAVRKANLLPQGSSRHAAIAAKLERKMKSDTVKQTLESRPDRRELIARGIMHSTRGIAPRLLGIAAQLEKRMTSDAVKRTLETRPDRAELIRRGIIVDKTPQEAAEASMERRSMLEHFLQTRPSARDVNETRRLSTAAVASHGIARQRRMRRESEDLDEEAAEAEREQWVLPRAKPGSVRARVALALKVAARLEALGYVDAAGKGALKEKVFDGNIDVFRAVQRFEENGDGAQLVEALLEEAR